MPRKKRLTNWRKSPASLADGTTPTSAVIYQTDTGTPAYMSPKQARREVDMIDERTDVYGLSALIKTRSWRRR